MQKKQRLKLFIPLIFLCLLGIFLLRGLWLDPKKLPSALIGKPVPRMHLPVLSFDSKEVKLADLKTFKTPVDFAGQPWALNVFASWCEACLLEQPDLMKLAQQKKIKLVGLAYKDDLNATRQWLAEHGNPYDLILVDQDGQFGIDMGVYGVPETFVMDSNNTIVYKQVGVITPEFDKVLP